MGVVPEEIDRFSCECEEGTDELWWSMLLLCDGRSCVLVESKSLRLTRDIHTSELGSNYKTIVNLKT
jgi:hypothetical protein